MHLLRCGEASWCVGDMGESFHQIIDLRLNLQQDKAAILLNDGRHPDAFTAVLRPVGVTVCLSGVMESPHGDSGSQAMATGSSDTVFEELEGVQTLQWMADGQHIVYSRVGALGSPTEAWLHLVGTPESMDRQLYDEVGATVRNLQQQSFRTNPSTVHFAI